MRAIRFLSPTYKITGRVINIAMLGLSLLLVPGLALAELVVLNNNGEIWRYTGTACNAAGCPGWVLIDRDARTQQISSQVGTFGGSRLFQRQADGSVWKWDGVSTCSKDACPGWTLINTSPHTKDIVASSRSIFIRYDNGEVWKSDGSSPCSGGVCPGWTQINRDPLTRELAAGLDGDELFIRLDNGSVWKWDGRSQCDTTGCPGWTLIDRDPRTRGMAAGGVGTGFGGVSLLYLRHANGDVWKWDGKSRCEGAACPGWTLIDRDPRTRGIVSGLEVDKFFLRQDNGALWRWDGNSSCNGPVCPGWTLINSSPHTKDFVASPYSIFIRYDNGEVWKSDGTSHCVSGVCPGWVQLNRDPHIVAMVPFDALLPPRNPSDPR